MSTTQLGKRYSEALDLALSENSSVPAAEALQLLKNISEGVLADQKTKSFFMSPLMSVEVKKEMFKSVMDKVKAPIEIINFFNLLFEKNRFAVLPEIVQEFEKKLNKKQNVESGTIRSATPLNDQQKAELKKLLEAQTSKSLKLEFVVDESLIGGIVANVGDWIFDDSISYHLTRMKENLTGSVH